MARKGDTDRIEDPDVEIGASVKAKRLRFRRKPKTKVDFHGELQESGGDGELRTASGSERENLPDEVEPGVTYEDVRVRWRAAARLKSNPSKGADDEKQGERQERRHP
jgi:hypothetical protein